MLTCKFDVRSPSVITLRPLVTLNYALSYFLIIRSLPGANKKSAFFAVDADQHE